MYSRMDNRDLNTFKKHIKFSTLLEGYFFNKWLEIVNNHPEIEVRNAQDNGIDNTGEFIPKGKTAGADYMIDIEYESMSTEKLPLEIKWVPTYGKLTLKEGDIKAYIRENAAILFIYSSIKQDIDLRTPKDYNLDNHIQKIRSIASQLRWAIMMPEKVKDLLDEYRNNGWIKNIHYMGNKPGLVLKQSEFSKWMKEEPWS